MTTIGLIGTRDGVGATTVAVNLAIVLKRETSGRLLFVDLDCDHVGDAAFLLGTKEGWRDLAEIASLREKLKPQLLSGYLTRHPKGVDLVSFPRRSSNGLLTTELPETLTFLSTACDTMIFDLGSRWNRYNTKAISLCSEVWLVANGDPVGIPEVQKKLEALRNAYYPGDRIRLLINGLNEEAALPLSTLADRVGRTPDLVLPQDAKKFVGFALEGTPIVVGDLRHRWTRGLENWVTERLQKGGFGSPSDTFPLTLQWPDSQPKNSSPPSQSPSSPVSAPVPPPSLAPTPAFVLDPERDRLKEEILERLLKKINPKEIEKGNPEALKRQTHDAVVAILDEMGKEGIHSLPQDRKRLVEEVLNEAVGLGPLEDLLGDPSISEIMVNAKDEIYAEKKGRLTRVPMSFTSEKQMMRVVERIVAPIGRRVDESSPLVDARLQDGSRVNIIIPPLALKGPTITIRRFAKERLGAPDLIRFGAMNEAMATLIKLAIEAKLNIVVSGGTGTGKTTLLNVLSSLIPNNERIVTIEDAAELQLQQDHVVRLESRPPNIEGRGAIEIRDLVKNALRMRPDRIVVGECRGGEALDMLQAMNTGHDGSLTTLHANTPRDALARLETLVMFAGVDLPSRAIREQTAAAVQLILQLKRFEDGSRKIVQITEITGMEGDVIVMQDVFSFRQEGIDQNRKIQGKFASSGFIPKFVSHLQKKGIEIPPGIFAEPGLRVAQGGSQ